MLKSDKVKRLFNSLIDAIGDHIKLVFAKRKDASFLSRFNFLLKRADSIGVYDERLKLGHENR